MKKLFKSKTSYELIDLFVNNQEKIFYLAELSKMLKKDPANIIRELDRLMKEKIIKINIKDNKKYYSFDKEGDFSKELAELFKKITTSDFKDKFDTKWLLAEEIPNICPFFSQIWLNCFVDEFNKPGGIAYKKIAAIHRDYNLCFYYDKKDANEVGEYLVNRFIKDPNFMNEVNRQIIKHSDQLRSYCEKLPETNLNKLSKKQLWDYYKKHEDIHTQHYQWAWIPVAVDMFCHNLTKQGKIILKNLGVKEENIEEYLYALTQPTKPSLLKTEQDELVKIGIKVQKNKKDSQIMKGLFRKFKEEDVKRFGLYTHSPEYEKKFEQTVKKLENKINPLILNSLQKHYAKYFYTKFLFTEEQGVYNFEHYLKSLVRLVNRENDLEKSLKDEHLEFQKNVIKRNKLIQKLKLNKNTIKFFDAWGDFMLTKVYRRYDQLFALYKMTPIMNEVSRRLNLNLKEVRFMKSDEIYNGLINGVINNEEIKNRVSFSVYYATKNEHIFYCGNEAKKATKYIQKDKMFQVLKIQGQCGCRGEAKGIVKIVNVSRDIQKIKPKEILVSIATQPDLLPAMKKASAFITDQGGVTSHAAIVAREMNTPCVIGTKIATKVLKDGDEVEVDANRGVVKIIK